MSKKPNETPEQYNARMLQRDKDDLRAVLGTAYGRRVIWKLVGRCGVFRASFVQGEADSTAYNEGRRSIGSQLLMEIFDVTPEAYKEMAKQAKEDADELAAIQKDARAQYDEGEL